MAVILTSAGRAYADAIIEVIAGLNKCPGCSPIEKAERQPCADSPLASRSQHVIASAPVW
jgi:hypothetical protein